MQSHRQTLIHIMQNPAAYGHPVAEIGLRETHISLVFLTGQYVYKVKKAVNFGFLDFSSLDQRRFFCAEEVRLNRRLAPELYLDVVPVHGGSNSVGVGGAGPIIDYAVKMRQFDTSQEFDKLLAAGTLGKELIDAAAKVLADFHLQATVAEQDQPYGTQAAVQDPIHENFDQIDLLGDAWLESHGLLGLLRQLRRWAGQQSRVLAPLIEDRKLHGFVRECHGDLHLRNIVNYRGRVTPFDGIEFNPNLRWIDVISDIAFLMMDLEDHGRDDLSRRLRNQYLSFTGDYAGLGVLRYYLAYRAMVRAKVAGLQLLQQDGQGDGLTKEVENYVRLASRYAVSHRPQLILCHGLSGSGKTYVSQQVLEQADVIRIRSDVERKRLFGEGSTQQEDSGIAGGIYTSSAGQETYRRLLRLADTVLKSGYTVLVDATFLQQHQRQMFYDYADHHELPLLICHTVADLAIQMQRVEGRQHAGQDASDAGVAVLQSQLQKQQPMTDAERRRALTIDTSRTPDIEPVLDWLRQSQGLS